MRLYLLDFLASGCVKVNKMRLIEIYFIKTVKTKLTTICFS